MQCDCFLLLGTFSIQGKRDIYRFTNIEKYKNTCIQKYRYTAGNTEERAKGVQCAGFPLLEAFPIQGRGERYIAVFVE